MGLYLITPILRIYLKQADKKNIEYFLFLWFIANFIYPLINRAYNINIGIPLYLATGFIGYYLIGFYLYNFKFTFFQKRILYALGLLGFLLTILGTYLLTSNSGVPDEWFYEYLNPTVVFPSIAIVLFVKNIDWNLISKNKAKLSKLIIKTSETSLGLYLLHPIILEFLAVKGMTSLWINPIIGIPLTFLLTTLISLSIIFILQKIPVIKKIV
jgi:surface polysaccharide O-acyltransferase-like enzyme